MAEWIRKQVLSTGILFLEMVDKNGQEYMDGSIVRADCKGKPALGYICYFAGRFEIVCPFKDQRFIFGLNTCYEIVGHMITDSYMIEHQEEKNYAE